MVDYSQSSEADIHKDIRQPGAIEELASLIGKFKIKSELDRKLLLGVLLRDSQQDSLTKIEEEQQAAASLLITNRDHGDPRTPPNSGSNILLGRVESGTKINSSRFYLTDSFSTLRGVMSASVTNGKS